MQRQVSDLSLPGRMKNMQSDEVATVLRPGVTCMYGQYDL